MFRIIDFTYLIRSVAVLTTILSVLIYELLKTLWIADFSVVRIFSIVPWVSLAIVSLLTAAPAARFIWRVISIFRRSLYPDLNGIWEGEIVFEAGARISARAIIRQSLLNTQIDLHTETSKSFSLETTPTLEGGQFKLYYTYQSKPKNPNWSTYTGSTIFDVRAPVKNPARPMELSGYYFTSRKTNGRIALRLIKGKIDTDVSYY
jgi:SMODS-associating 2TM, beta-strand rich effector domain